MSYITTKEPIYVGTGGKFDTLHEAITYLESNMDEPMSIRILNDLTIATPITINLPYLLTIDSIGYGQCTLTSTVGAGLSMFNLYSDVCFNRLYFIGAGDETCLNYTGTGVTYNEVKDFLISNFNIGMNCVQPGSEYWIFEGGVNNCNNCAIIEGDGTKFRSTINDWTGLSGITFTSGQNMYFSSENDTSNQVNATDTVFVKPDTTGVTFSECVILGCLWNNVGTFRSGFDFTTKRDADIELLSNSGDEDMRPHAKINVIGNTGTTAINADTYVKVNYDVSSTYLKKFSFTNNNLTYLPTHKKAVLMWISGTLTTSTSQSNVLLSICKNGITGTTYGTMNIFLDQNARAFNFSTNIYIDDVLENEYFAIYAKNTGTPDTIILQDMNMLVLSQ